MTLTDENYLAAGRGPDSTRSRAGHASPRLREHPPGRTCRRLDSAPSAFFRSKEQVGEAGSKVSRHVVTQLQRVPRVVVAVPQRRLRAAAQAAFRRCLISSCLTTCRTLRCAAAVRGSSSRRVELACSAAMAGRSSGRSGSRLKMKRSSCWVKLPWPMPLRSCALLTVHSTIERLRAGITRSEIGHIGRAGSETAPAPAGARLWVPRTVARPVTSASAAPRPTPAVTVHWPTGKAPG
jgi:hypothetical protein